LSKITSIATKVPQYKHEQNELYHFANSIYCNDETESRKLKFLYHQSGIENRYSVIPDFTKKDFEPVLFENNITQPSVQKRLAIYDSYATNLSANTIVDCISSKIELHDITHLITVSCTGMSAPGLDLKLVDALQLKNNIQRTSINFMGCYAAIHALKMADAICNNDAKANVVIVCIEFCTLHFQHEATLDNITSSLLFADGCAAVLVQNNSVNKGIAFENFYSEINIQGKDDMSWKISENGFLMTLSGYVPDLIKADFDTLTNNALAKTNRTQNDVTHWCIHPGGKKILDTIKNQLNITDGLKHSYQILNDYGNMSSPTILFVLEKIFNEIQKNETNNAIIFGAAFGPGLTMETFTATYA
jgi:predicted naringenin-chalcone synthase